MNRLRFGYTRNRFDSSRNDAASHTSLKEWDSRLRQMFEKQDQCLLCRDTMCEPLNALAPIPIGLRLTQRSLRLPEIVRWECRRPTASSCRQKQHSHRELHLDLEGRKPLQAESMGVDQELSSDLPRCRALLTPWQFRAWQNHLDCDQSSAADEMQMDW